MADHFTEASWYPEFKPGWPDILPLGLIVGRLQIQQRDAAPDVDPSEDETELDWVMHAAITSESPRLAFLGELTLRNALAFAGIVVILPIVLREEPETVDDEYTDDLLRQYGEWASSFMYDYAASNLRAGLAGNGLIVEVPFGTPQVSLHTSDVDDDVTD